MFNFTPLLGAQSTSAASQSLLELDGGIKILVDVGWDERFDAEKLKELERQIPTLSIVLLTHATTAHLGAFVHCCKHFPLFKRIPVYATNPVISLGRTLLQDVYSSTPLAASIIPEAALSESAYSYPSVRAGGVPNILLQLPTADEIARFFSLINPLKYSQSHQPLPSPFSPPLNGLTITAYGAGHTLGGTIWHIQHGLESIVYSVDWNQSRENVFPGAEWLSETGAEVKEQLRRPTALVCSSKGAERVAPPGGRKKRDDTLLNMIRDTVSNGGTVLIPTDSSARVLELAYLLENAWQAAHNGDGHEALKESKLYLAGRTGGATMRHVRSMLEWMNEGIVRDFETASGAQGSQGHRRNRSRGGVADGERGGKDELKSVNAPFNFKHLKLLERKSQLRRMLSQTSPRVILASDSSLEWGFSRDAILKIAKDKRNLIILTERPSRPDHGRIGLAGSLFGIYEEKAGTGPNPETDTATVVDMEGRELAVETAETAALAANEVPLYQQYLARQRQLHNTMHPGQGASLETSADVVDDRSSTTSTTSEDSDEERQGKVLNVSAALNHSRHKLGLSNQELGVNVLIRGRTTHDYDVRGKKGRETMFPFVAKRRRADDFGDVIRPEDYIREEEKDEVNGEDQRDREPKKESALGQKRKWDDVATKSGPNGHRTSNGVNKRRKNNEDQPKEQRDAAGNGVETSDADDSESSEEEGDVTTAEGPLKVTVSKESMTFECKIGYIDFAGLHDKRSLQMLIPLIRPRKLILVAGEKEETLALAADCRKLLNPGSENISESSLDVYTPVIGTTVDASVDTNAWTLKLSHHLARRLHWQNVRGLGVVAITGLLESESAEDEALQENAKKKQKMTTGEKKDSESSTPVLDVVPASMAGATRSVAQPLHVGDLRLADLRKLMQASGLTAEFRGEGTLLVNGIVAVRKSSMGKIEVDGGGVSVPGSNQTDGTFNKVKRKIYEGLAVVTGG
ncbi:hypothetical protein H2201_004711 [Coniosporium apollinis]|uniref:Cleavage and polyadenylation specificity factor subunit 2 n=1 Tax=Coniosporium apollinis TaxID=61459 RepID=A0ABQ9NS65_9PEZI|nr:hypothetical protein H2201_004711 [Coniosporium apollinis]